MLLRIGAGRNGSTDWWTNHHLDDLAILGAIKSTPYVIWANGHGLVGDDAAEDKDLDGDGWANLHEYGMGLNPTNDLTEGGAYPMFVQSGGGMIYVYAQRNDDPSLAFSLQASTDLSNPGGWGASGFSVSGTNVTGGTFDYVTNTVPTTEAQKFIRLGIEMAP